MANLNDIKIANNLISRITNIVKKLDDVASVSPEIIYDKINKLKDLQLKINNLTKITHHGKFSPALQRKLLKLIEWKNVVDQHLQQEASMKKNKSSVLDNEEVEKYIDYIEKIEHFVNHFPDTFESLKTQTSTQIYNLSYLKKHLSKFQLQESDVLSPDQLLADTEFQVVEPVKTLKMAKASIFEFAKMIKKVNTLKQEIENLLKNIGQLSLEQTLEMLNKKNLLVKSLIQNLATLNKTIYTANFSSNLLIRDQYNQLLVEVSKYLPNHFVSKFVLPSSKVDQLTENSVGGIKEKLKEPIDTFVSPHQKYTPSVFTVAPAKNVETPTLVNKPALSPEEKAKYEKLWEEN